MPGEGSDNSLEIYRFLAVSSLFDTAERSRLKFCLSSGLLESLHSLSFMSDFISGVTQGLCLGGMVMVFLGATWSNAEVIAEERDDSIVSMSPGLLDWMTADGRRSISCS